MSEPLSLSSQLQELQQHITCPGCCEVSVQPSSLPCGHTLCRRCLDQRRYSGHSGHLRTRPETLPACPSCHAVIKSANPRQSSVDFTRQLSWKLMKLLPELQRAEARHQSPPGEDRCENHRNLYTYFCGTCDVVGCGDCLLEQTHSGHHHCRLQDAAPLRRLICEKLGGLVLELDELQKGIENIRRNVSDLRTSNEDLAKQRLIQVAVLSKAVGLPRWRASAEGSVQNRRAECEKYTTELLKQSSTCHSRALKFKEEVDKMMQQEGQLELALVFSRFVREVDSHKKQYKLLLEADKTPKQCFDLALKNVEQLTPERPTFSFSLEKTEMSHLYVLPALVEAKGFDDPAQEEHPYMPCGGLSQEENPYEEMSTIGSLEIPEYTYQRKEQARPASLRALPPFPPSHQDAPFPPSHQDAPSPHTTSEPAQVRISDEKPAAHDSGKPPSFPSLSSSSDEDRPNATGPLEARFAAASSQQAGPAYTLTHSQVPSHDSQVPKHDTAPVHNLAADRKGLPTIKSRSKAAASGIMF